MLKTSKIKERKGLYWARSIREGFLEKLILKLNFEQNAVYRFLKREEMGEFSKIGDPQEPRH